MKKIGLILLFTVFACGIFATEHTLYSGKCYEYNSLLKDMIDKDFAIRYDDSENQYYLLIADWMKSAWICLGEQDLARLRSNFEKYFEWEKLALEKSVELNKKLPNSTITTKVIWKWGDNFYFSNNFDVDFTFFSQNANLHHLVITSNKVTSSSNQFISYIIDGLYFNSNQVKSFYKAIDATNLKNKIDKINENKNMEDLFN